MTESEYKKDIVKKCPSCGSALVYSPADKSLKCPSCGFIQENQAEDTNNIATFENDFHAQANLNEQPEKITVHCPSCGAESIFPDNMVAGFCSFCKSPIVAADKTVKSIRPHGLIPFAIQKKDAAQSFSKWVKSRWFAPNALKKAALSQNMTGSFYPSWTFDFDTKCVYTGRRGIEHKETRTRTVNGKTQTTTVTRVVWYNTSGVVFDKFDDVLVPASSKLAKDRQNEVENWSLKNAIDYNDDKIRGFVEYSYDLPLNDGLTHAKEKAQSTIKSHIRRDIGGDRQEILTMNVMYANLTFKQLLLPFWTSAYRYGGKNYEYVVNGETGKAGGSRPYSVPKILFAVLLGLIAFIGIVTILLNLD